MNNMYLKIIRSLLVTVTLFILGISNAKALLIDSVVPVPGGPVISDNIAVGLSSTGITFGGGPTGVATGGTFVVPIPGLLSSGSLITTGPVLSSGTFSVLNPFVLPSNSLFLTGGLLDVKENVGSIDTLFMITGGSAAPNFGNYAVLTLASPHFSPGTIAGLQSLSGVNNTTAALTIRSVDAVVSQPSILLLIVAGLIAFLTASAYPYSRVT